MKTSILKLDYSCICLIALFSFVLSLFVPFLPFEPKLALADMKKLSESSVTYCAPLENVGQGDLTLLFVGVVNSVEQRVKDANYSLAVSPKEWFVQNASSTTFYLITPISTILPGQTYAFYTNVPYTIDFPKTATISASATDFDHTFDWASTCMYPKLVTPAIETTLVNPLVTYNYFSFNKNLGTGMTDPDVIELQKFLNTTPNPVSTEGYGSAGQENDYFGTRTRASVAAFQKEHAEEIGIRVATGFFGDKTREFVNNIRKTEIENKEICSIPRTLVDQNEFKDRRGIDGSFVGYVKKNGKYFSINGYVLDSGVPLDAYVDKFVSVVGKLRQYYVGEKYFEEIQPQRIVCERIPVVLSEPEPVSTSTPSKVAPIIASSTPSAAPSLTPAPSLIPLSGGN